MYNHVFFWVRYLLFALQLIWFLNDFFCYSWSQACKTRSQSRETNNPPYIENNYRIEVKITFMLTAYLVLLCEFFWEFSIFHLCRPQVDIYWHPLLIQLFEFGGAFIIPTMRFRMECRLYQKYFLPFVHLYIK